MTPLLVKHCNIIIWRHPWHFATAPLSENAFQNTFYIFQKYFKSEHDNIKRKLWCPKQKVKNKFLKILNDWKSNIISAKKSKLVKSMLFFTSELSLQRIYFKFFLC